MTNEVDFAMKYAEERKMRMHLETRLNGFLFDIMAYLNSTWGLIEGVLTENEEVTKEHLEKLVVWRADVETQLVLNLLNPAGITPLLKNLNHPRFKGLGNVPEEDQHRMAKQLHAANKESAEDWENFAKQHQLCGRKEMANNFAEEYSEMIVKGMMEKTNREKQEAATGGGSSPPGRIQRIKPGGEDQ